MKTLKQLHAIAYAEALEKMENELWEADYNDDGTPYKFPPQTLRAVSKVFASVLWDVMYTQQDMDNTPMEKRLKQVAAAGKDLHKFVMKYTGLDPHNFYKE